MKIISKDFCTFRGVYIDIYMGPCCKSYILLVRIYRASEMLDKWSPTSKLYDIKLSHIPDGRYVFFCCTRTYLSAIPIKMVFRYLQIFSCICYDWVLSIGYCVNFAHLGVTLGLSTFHNFSNVLVDKYFSWLYLNFDWLSFCGVFSRWIFSWPEKKDTVKKTRKKCLPKLSQTPITPSQDRMIRVNSLADFSLGASSGRKFFRFNTWHSFLLWW